MTIGIELAFPERALLDEIADPRMTQKDITLTYALAIRSGEDVDWPKVNQAIIERWSPSGFRRVKDGAWRKLREAKNSQSESR